MANIRFTLANGRTIGVNVFGNTESRKLVVVCHPAPGSGVFDPDPTLSSSLDVRFVGIDRPGYGASDPIPDDEWPSIPRMAQDIAEYLRNAEGVADELGLLARPTVGVVGWGAGGRVALALAALHPDLVSRVVITGTPAPQDEVPWMPVDYEAQLEVYAHMRLLDTKEHLSQWFLEEAPSHDHEADPPLELIGAGDVDEHVLERPGVLRRLGDMLGQAFEHGGIGAATDVMSYAMRPWGFDPAQVGAPTLLLYGQDDPLGPDHARWYADRLPHATLELVPHVGNLAFVPEWARIVRFLAGEG